MKTKLPLKSFLSLLEKISQWDQSVTTEELNWALVLIAGLFFVLGMLGMLLVLDLKDYLL